MVPSWRGLPPQPTLDWVAEAVGGGRILTVHLLRVGGWHTNHAISIADRKGRTRDLVLRRWARPGWEVEDPDFTASREAVILGLLERGGMPTPRLIAADPVADVCDVPALLITRLPGHAPGRVRDLDSLLSQLAEMLIRIHRLDAAGSGVPGYRTYLPMNQAALPEWLEGDPLWPRAFAVAREAVAEAMPTCFIHRDYHPGNALWMRGQLTGVVDWTQASLGPPGVDVGTMRWNLAADHGLAAADRFQDLYAAAGQRELCDQPRWDLVTLMDLVLYMSDEIPPSEMAPLRAHAQRCLRRIAG